MRYETRSIDRRAGWLVLLLALAIGCGRYDPVSPLAYEYAKALYSICNRKSEAQLAPLADQISGSVAKGDLSQQEAAWLDNIIEQATAGQWEAARGESRRLLEDQATGR